jgi:hypothetical protein
MIHHEPVNLHDVDLNSDLMVVMKVCLNQDEQGGQKTNHQMMDDQKMNVQKMDVRNYLDDLNFRDVLPCAYSLISIQLIYFDHTKKY